MVDRQRWTVVARKFAACTLTPWPLGRHPVRRVGENKVTSKAPDAAENTGEIALVVSPRAAALDNTKSPRVLLQQVGLHIAEQLGVAELAGDQNAGKRWNQHGYRAVIAAGGDGTVGTTVSHVAGTGIPLGILPLGTSNDVARALGIPLDTAAAAAVIASGVPVEVDCGRVRETHSDRRPDSVSAWHRLVSKWLRRWVPYRWSTDPERSLYFLHAATLGLNVEFARLATDASRRLAMGSLTYPASSLEALTHLRSIPVRVQLAGVPTRDPDTVRQSEGIASESRVSLTTEVLQLAVVNTPMIGGTLNLSLPGVDAHDHLLDVFLVEPLRLDKHLDRARAVMERLHVPRDLYRRHRPLPPVPEPEVGEDHRLGDQAGYTLFPGIRRYQAQAVSIETAVPVPMTLDGELRAQTPVQIWVESAALAVLLPRAETGGVADSGTGASIHSPSERPF
jgi:diacylglycerol kinase (ATP)